MSEINKEYYGITGGRPPHTRTEHAFKLFQETHNPIGLQALDFGCGAGRDSRFLLDQGMAVTAVDMNINGMASLADAERLTIVQSRFDQFTFGEYDFISSQWALSFNSPETFTDMFKRLTSSLRPGGIITCNIFGKRDEWANDPSRTFLDEDEINALLDGLKDIEVIPTEEDGTLANGTPKHWHYYDILARK
jgi:trans-aconitate methyltransferase